MALALCIVDGEQVPEPQVCFRNCPRLGRLPSRLDTEPASDPSRGDVSAGVSLREAQLPPHTHSLHGLKQPHGESAGSRHSADGRGPTWDPGRLICPFAGVTGSRPLNMSRCLQPVLPRDLFLRSPGTDWGFFADSAVRSKVELLHGPWTDCRHKRRSKYKRQRVSVVK